MPALSLHDGDFHVTGTLTAANMFPSDASVQDATVRALANVAATKLEHQDHVLYSQPSAMDALPESRVVYVVYGATGSVVSFKAGSVTPAGSTTTWTVDLKKNGSTILSSPISLDNSLVAYELAAGVVSSASLVTGDVLEVVIAGSGTNEPRGVFAALVVRVKAV